jgi:5-methylcytosine-specific restriction enzyme A
MDFIKNNFYNRRKLHEQYGGNQQSGISNCPNHSLILIFTGSSGEQYGYEDGWDNEGFFRYTGQGQKGDMKFIRGNKALLEHKQNNQKVFLFEETKRSGFWKYHDELKLDGYDYFISNDKEGKKRNSIKFRFISSKDKENFMKENELTPTEYNSSAPNRTERKGLVTSRVGQGVYRKKIIEKWSGKCPITNCSILTILISSHIVPWSQSDNKERLDVENGILLSPLYDALFDRHLISFDDDGEILLSDNLEESKVSELGINVNSKIPITKGMKKYLKRHRDIFLKKIKVVSDAI